MLKKFFFKLSKYPAQIVIILFLGLLILVSTNSCKAKEGAETKSQKEQRKLEKKKIKQEEKDYKKALKRHRKIQTKDTRKKMRHSKKTSLGQTPKRKRGFFARIFRPKKKCGVE